MQMNECPIDQVYRGKKPEMSPFETAKIIFQDISYRSLWLTGDAFYCKRKTKLCITKLIYYDD